jgi:hypothetical protein
MRLLGSGLGALLGVLMLAAPVRAAVPQIVAYYDGGMPVAAIPVRYLNTLI